MSVGTPFHERTSGLNAKLAWGDWAGYPRPPVRRLPRHRVQRHPPGGRPDRRLAALQVRAGRAGRAAAGRPGDHPRRHPAAVGQVMYTPWCDERGKVIDDGTVARLDDDRFRWTAADPSYRWLRMNAGDLDVEIEDVTETARTGPAGAAGAGGAGGGDRRVVRGRGLLPAPPLVSSPGSRSTSRAPATRATWATSCGSRRRPPGRLWDALFEAGADHGSGRPASAPSTWSGWRRG